MPRLYIHDESGQRLVDYESYPVVVKLIEDDEIEAMEEFIRRTTADSEDFDRGGLDNFKGRVLIDTEINLNVLPVPPRGILREMRCSPGSPECHTVHPGQTHEHWTQFNASLDAIATGQQGS